jgi:hypothetical protein
MRRFTHVYNINSRLTWTSVDFGGPQNPVFVLSHGRGHWFDPSTTHHKSISQRFPLYNSIKKVSIRHGPATLEPFPPLTANALLMAGAAFRSNDVQEFAIITRPERSQFCFFSWVPVASSNGGWHA